MAQRGRREGGREVDCSQRHANYAIFMYIRIYMFVRKRSSTQPELQMCIEVHKAAAAGKPEYDAPLPPLLPSLVVAPLYVVAILR